MIGFVALTPAGLIEVRGAGLPRLNAKLVQGLQGMIDRGELPALPPYSEPPIRLIFPGISRLQ
jgi:hypothetical protein